MKKSLIATSVTIFINGKRVTNPKTFNIDPYPRVPEGVEQPAIGAILKGTIKPLDPTPMTHIGDLLQEIREDIIKTYGVDPEELVNDRIR
jgi:hypothetical protein